jgi:hypothetical protein
MVSVEGVSGKAREADGVGTEGSDGVDGTVAGTDAGAGEDELDGTGISATCPLEGPWLQPAKIVTTRRAKVSIINSLLEMATYLRSSHTHHPA